MYEAFYGLKVRPFNLTPDPKFLYLSDKHKEAFAHLLFGIKNRSGFVMVTGEIGTGKTTICRNLINQLNQDVNLALIFNPSLNPVELMQKINAEFGIAHDAENVRELVDQLNVYLLEQAAQDRSCVLIIDEAQNLSPTVLEQIRLLSNLETETEKLLQIILIGQPELAEKLELHELRQLNQRITARYHLKPLDQKETYNYIHYRMHVAGGRRKLKFTPASVRTVFKHSKGTPRVINALCDRCLLIGYTRETHVISPRIVKQAARELRGSYRESVSGLRRKLRALLPAPGTALMAGAIVLVIAIAGMIFSEPIRQLARELGAFNRILAGATPSASTDGPAPAVTADAPAGTPNVAEAKVEPPATPPALVAVLNTIAQNNAPATPAAPPLAEQLSQLAAPDALEAGAAALLAAWNAPLNGPYPVAPTPGEMNAFASRHGLANEYLRPALDQLLAINLPALVKVSTVGNGLWVGLIGVADGKLLLTGAKGARLETTREAFAPLYAKEAFVLWKDAAPRGSALMPGRASRQVAAFKEQLRGLGRLRADNTSDQYDQETATAVSRIQSETGLLLDGIAGKQVRMVMQSWSGGPEVPRLDAQSNIGVAGGSLSTAGVMQDGAARVAEQPVPAESSEPAAPGAEPAVAATNAPDSDALPDWPTATPATPPAPPVEEAPVVIPEAPVAEVVQEAPPVLTEEAPPSEEPVAEPGEATASVSTEPAGVVQVEELKEPVEGAFVPEVDDSRKETTPPLNGSAPLVPAGE